MKSKGFRNVTDLKFEDRTRTQSRTRSPIWRSLITTEWTAEKLVGKRVKSKQTPKHKLAATEQIVETAGRPFPQVAKPV